MTEEGYKKDSTKSSNSGNKFQPISATIDPTLSADRDLLSNEKSLSFEELDNISNEFTNMKTAVVEMAVLINSVGLFDNLTPKVREYLVNNQDVAQAIARGDSPGIDPRMSLNEYCQHILKIFDPPAAQKTFYITIAKVCYLMILAEKNPIVAQELRGVVQVSGQLDALMKV